MKTWVWMRHETTGGVQRFAGAAVAAWKAMGWVECDPPAEQNLAIDPSHPAPVDEPAPPHDPPTSPTGPELSPTPATDAPAAKTRRRDTAGEQKERP